MLAQTPIVRERSLPAQCVDGAVPSRVATCLERIANDYCNGGE